MIPIEMVFANRCSAGRGLAALLTRYRTAAPVVLALPRGGVPVAYEVAHALAAPLRLLVVRKVVVPGRPPRVVGAVTAGAAYLDAETIALLGIPDAWVEAAVERERGMAARRLRELGGDSPLELEGRTALIVDDGIVTGASALAALSAVRARHAARAVVAAPVCAPGAGARVRAQADDLVCVSQPEDVRALACWYADFSPPSDAEIRRLLGLARLEREADFRCAGAAS